MTTDQDLNAYRKLLRDCAEGKAAIPPDGELEPLCLAAGRRLQDFKRTLELVKGDPAGEPAELDAAYLRAAGGRPRKQPT